jgi:hypothetical protein
LQLSGGMMRTLATTLAFAALAACASSSSTTTTPAPTLEVTSPARGTTVDGTSVTVAGTVKDAPAGTRVTVNGMETTLGADGSFSTSVTVTEGIAVMETHAIDKAGHDIRDVRAVLAGSLGTTDGTAAAPVGAHASVSALNAIAKAMASDAAAVDYNAEVQKANPIYSDTSCNGAVVNVTGVDVGNINVGITPQTGALGTAVELDNVTVHLHAHYRVVCIGGDADITITTSAAHINGDLGVSIASGKVATSLSGLSVNLDNFDLNVGGAPDFIVNLFNGTVRSRVESALQNVINSKLPPIANDKLAGLLAKPFNAKLLGYDTKITVTPTKAQISPTGVFVGVDTKVLVTGGSGGMYVMQTPASAESLMGQTRDLGVAVANDLVNQLLAGMWAAGAFEKTVPVSTLSVVASLLDPDAAQLKLSISLPPTVQSDGTGNLQLAIGDAIISVQDANGQELQKLALSVQTSLAMSATSSGALSLALGNPTVYAQVLGQVDDGSRPLSGMQVEGIVTGAWGVLSQQAGDALAKLPMPSVAGVKIGAPTVQALSNYLLADIPLQ